MKSLLLGLIYFFLFSINLQEVRQLYPKAKDDAFIVDSLYSQLSSVGIKDNLVLYGYKDKYKDLLAGLINKRHCDHAKGVRSYLFHILRLPRRLSPCLVGRQARNDLSIFLEEGTEIILFQQQPLIVFPVLMEKH